MTYSSYSIELEFSCFTFVSTSPSKPILFSAMRSCTSLILKGLFRHLIFQFPMAAMNFGFLPEPLLALPLELVFTPFFRLRLQGSYMFCCNLVLVLDLVSTLASTGSVTISTSPSMSVADPSSSVLSLSSKA